MQTLYNGTIASLAPIPNPDFLRELGLALDTEPRLAPDLLDLHDEPKTRITSAEAALTTHADRLLRGSEMIFFDRLAGPDLSGDIDLGWAAPETWDEANLFGDEEDLHDPWLRQAVTDLFIRLCIAMDAFHGFLAHEDCYRSQIQRLAYDPKLRPDCPGGAGTPFYPCGLGDVGWVNYYGPAYVARWRDRLTSLGIRQQPTDNGGIVIWSTETPFVFDPKVRRSTDYPWRKPFLDALPGVYMQEDAEPVKPGQLVPTFDEHAAAATRYTARGPEGTLRT